MKPRCSLPQVIWIAMSAMSLAVHGVSASEFRVQRGGNSSQACVEADFNGAAFSLPYPCVGRDDRAKDDRGTCTAVLSLSADKNSSRVSGDCGNRTARLEVAWSDGRLRLEMRFSERTFDNVWTQVTPPTVTYSFVSDLRLFADLRDPAFTNASILHKDESAIVEYWLPHTERTLLLFAAPVGSAFVCHSPEAIQLHWRRVDDKKGGGSGGGGGGGGGGVKVGALAHFPTVRLLTSLDESDTRREKTHEGAFLCEADSKRHRTGIVALAIAGVIGACMLVIVAGYLATRLSKDSRYSNME